MSPQVEAMLELVRDTDELKRHVDDALIAEQLEPVERAEWLAKAERVRKARENMRIKLTEA